MKRERRTSSVSSINYPGEVSGSSITMNVGGILGMSNGGSGGAGRPPQQQQPLSPSSLGPPFSRSRSASTSALSTPTGSTPSPNGAAKRKGIIACQRCRTRKIRCDNVLPSCQGCVKAGVQCIEVDRAAGDNVPRSHVLELENRVKWLEEIIRGRCPDVDLSTGPTAELRSRPAPPAIRIVTTGPDMYPPRSSMSSTSSPVFALSPASTCATPASFDFSPGVSPGYLAPYSPYTFSDGGSPSPSPACSSPLLPSPVLPLRELGSQNVGFIPELATEGPKYIGSSSETSFLHLAFQDVHESGFRSATCGRSREEPDFGSGTRWPSISAEPANLPDLEECGHLSGNYFSTVSLQYPFIYRPQFEACLEAVYSEARGTLCQLPRGYTMAVARFHVFLVLSISAAILSGRVGRSMNSEGYFASAMRCVGEITLTGSIQAAQSALLLAMHSFYSPKGWNIWYLNAITMATCIDIGLQREVISPPGQDQSAIKRRVFWCAYVLDRTLGITLGRPFSLRDEAFDVDFPDKADNDEGPAHINSFPLGFSGSIYLFRITKILSGVKATIYGVSQPSAVGLPEWQASIHQQLIEIREEARVALCASRRGSGNGGTHLGSGQMVELKFYEAIQLLFSPSPAFPYPTQFGLQKCFTAAIETIRIYTKLWRYGELQSTWLTVHSIFVGGSTILCMHNKVEHMQATSEALIEDIKSCSSLLESLATRWPIARLRKSQFDEKARQILLANSGSSRMLSPRDGPRRASSSSPHGRVFPEPHSQTLEVPSMTHHATQQTQTLLGGDSNSWYSGGPAAITSVGSAPMDTHWVGTNWDIATDPLIPSDETRLKGMGPSDGNLVNFYNTGSGVGSGDTVMWDMEQGGP